MKKTRRLPGRRAVVPTDAITEVSAGGVVFKRSPTGIRVALLLDPYAKWTFAKGHVEKGETLAQAAIRETGEEMGLSGLKVVAPLGRIELWFRDRYRPQTKGRLIHKYVHYFLMQAPPSAKGRPQKQEKIRRIVWVGLRRLMTQSSYKDFLPILVRARRILRTLPTAETAETETSGVVHSADNAPAPPHAGQRPVARPNGSARRGNHDNHNHKSHSE